MRRVAAESDLYAASVREVPVTAFAAPVLESRFLEGADQLSNFLRHVYIVLVWYHGSQQVVSSSFRGER